MCYNSPSMHAVEFVDKWRKVDLTERSASQQHFLDLCELFNHPKPAEADPTGEWFTFEKGASKETGGEGWADVWKKGFFGWEYKGKHKDLDGAYRQLLLYRESLENPPLLVVCDMDRVIVHTNFTNTPAQIYEISLLNLSDPRSLEILNAVFHDPSKLRPGVTSQAITQEAASKVAEIAVQLRAQGFEPTVVAHFLDRVVFCFFAEDIGLLPDLVFSRLLHKSLKSPSFFSKQLPELFQAMSTGGIFALETIPHFNGDLFDAAEVLELTADDIEQLHQAAKLDWSAVDPSIFGTLFERGMDPAKRSQLGAHYTSREDIETLVEPVIMQPLRRRWEETRASVESALRKRKDGRKEAKKPIRDFLEYLSQIKVLDPACGSGNFLYVTLQKLKDLEKEAILFAMEEGFPSFFPMVGPWQLYGIEINPYAFELAQMTVWIGYLQWTKANGFGVPPEPILKRMDNFRCMDAILETSGTGPPCEPPWPSVDFIVSNPPFLGGKLLRRELGDSYVDQLYQVWSDAIPRDADLCCYWFEKARKHIGSGNCRRAGLLATQGIRGGVNRSVLKRIEKTGRIFFAESDRPWALEGANVHVSMVGFDDGSEGYRVSDGRVVSSIFTNLSSVVDLTGVRSLTHKSCRYLRPPEKGGKFELEERQAIELLQEPSPNGRPNSDVIRPWFNAESLVKSRNSLWIIDFHGLPEHLAASYEGPFAVLRANAFPFRSLNREKRLREKWWLYRRSGDEVRQASTRRRRLLCTPMVSKYRLFVWVMSILQPDKTLYAFDTDDDYDLGILHSRVHELWALKLGTRLETRPRYTPTSCFETFPFPIPTSDQRKAISSAAQDLDQMRNAWLNPPEWVYEQILDFPGSIDGPWRYLVHDPDERGIGTVRYPRIVPKDDDCAKKIQSRTLTNLYNQRPAWLEFAHHRLDEAVFAAYGWPPDLDEGQILERLLEVNLCRSEGES